MLTFISRMTVKAGRETEFEALCHELTEKALAHEPSTLWYRFFKLRDGERRYAVVESFVDEAAEEAHQSTSHFQTIAPNMLDCLEGEYVREYLDPLSSS